MMADKGHKVLTPGTPEYEAYVKKGLRTFSGGKTQETGIKQLGTKDYYLNELKVSYPKHYQRLTGNESTAELKEIIYRLDTEGIPFAKGGIANHFRSK